MQHDVHHQLDRLDARAGPAYPLSAAEAERRAQAVLRRLGPRARGGRARFWIVAAACLVAVGAWASVARLARKPAEPSERSAAPALSAPPAAARSSAPGSQDVAAAPPASEAPAPSAASAPGTSRDWLKLANTERKRHQYVLAHDLYLRALDAEPSSEAAYAAGVAAADLEREHLGRAQVALRRYEAALRARPQGALSEQARVGKALALGALGASEREAAAWRELLKAHPDSWFAEEARARLRVLNQR